jgi:hypothetical protein
MKERTQGYYESRRKLSHHASGMVKKKPHQENSDPGKV